MQKWSDGIDDVVAIGDAPLTGDKHGAIGVAIECHAEVSAGAQCRLHQFLGMERAAIQIDVAAIGLSIEQLSLKPKSRKKQRSDAAGGTVGAVNDKLEA